MNGRELYEKIRECSTLKDLLYDIKGKSDGEIQSKRGNLYEKIWDLVIKFGFCKYFLNDEYIHYEGNMNENNLKEVNNLQLYLDKLSIYSKGKGGSSDITLKNKITNKWIFISSKFYLDDSKKSIDNYDVEKILAVINEHNYSYKYYDIYLLVNNKRKVYDMVNMSKETNYYIKNNINQILDISDLEYYFNKFKDFINNIEFENINKFFLFKKIPLSLRFHQDLLIHKQIEQIKFNEKNILIGAKPRSGKTYIVGGLLKRFKKIYKKLNALIITPAPNETLSQFCNDLFNKFIDFIDINIIEIKKSSDICKVVFKENNIIILSKQLLDEYVLDKTIYSIKDLHLDFLIFDENHFHGTTEKSKSIFESYSSDNTVKLFLTATYMKPLNEWKIPENCQFYWDLEDEQFCKKRDLNSLIEKHGNDVLLFVNQNNIETKLSCYDKMPNLHIMTNLMDEDRFNLIKNKIKDSTFGFSNTALFSLTNSGDSFNFVEEVDLFLKYISGRGSSDDIIRDYNSIFERIKKVSNKFNTRTKLNNNDFTSQLWFLPFGKDMLIDDVSKCLKERMLKNIVLQNYEILIVNSKKDFKLKDVKNEIQNKELKAKKEGKNGLIILAGNQLTLGITLPFVDVVFLLNDISSSDKIFQMMYRCMTESLNENNNEINNGEKKIGYVVDFNISRILNNIFEYNIQKYELNFENKLNYIIENNLINIDSDLFYTKENKSELVKKLINLWKSNPVNNLNKLLKKIQDDYIIIDENDQKLLNQNFTIYFDKKISTKVLFDDENSQKINSGVSLNIETIEDDEDENKIKINISITRDILPFVIPLICILTINEENNDLLELLNIIENNKELLEIFNNQSTIWWNNDKVLEIIKIIINKYIKKDSYIYNLSINMKTSLQSLIDKPQELLEFIESCLKPKNTEKKLFGEVFTPISLVNDMLNSLDEQYLKINNTSIFSIPDFKWFDNSAGLGNFCIVLYLKLMNGLKDIIQSDSKRKTHILEKMIYMSELNKKNAFIISKIFGGNSFKLNLYRGDSLKLNSEKEWKVDKFDIIFGNPPYQKLVGKSHTQSIWNQFVIHSLNILKPDGFLVFVHPSGWRNIDGKFKDVQKEIFDRNLLYLEIHDEKDGLKTFYCETRYDWYVLQNRKVDKTETTIRFQDGKTLNVNVNQLEFIPNGEFKNINSLLAKNNEEKVEVLYSRSEYGTDKKNMQRDKNETFKYPIIYTINSNDKPSFNYSSVKKGHFGIPKLIWSNGRIKSIGSYIDDKGNYGLTQFAYAISDKPNNLEKIKKAFDSKEFRKLMEYCAVGQNSINHKVIASFRKDFWKDFLKSNKKLKFNVIK
jgi:hypothetical protein